MSLSDAMARQPADPRERSARIVAAVLGVLAPGLMVVANQSIHLVGPLGLTACAILVGKFGGAGERRPVSRGLSLEGVLLVLAFAWIFASLAWTLALASAAKTALHAGAVALTGWIGVVAAPRLLRPAAARVLAAGLAATAALVFLELVLDSPVRALFTRELGDFRYNRTLDTLVLLVWPAALYLALAGRGWWAAALGGLVALALVPSNAGSAALGTLVGAGTLALALVAGLAAVWLVGAAALAIVAATPWLMLHLGELLPGWAHAMLASTHSQIRGEIWRWHAAAAEFHRIRGWGFNATREIAAAPELAAFPPEARRLIAGHLHPHNAVFQVWSELGLVGAAILAALLVAVLRRIAGLPPRSRAFALAAFAAAFTIAYVSHGAWQAWWLATLALTIAWFAVVVPAERGRN